MFEKILVEQNKQWNSFDIDLGIIRTKLKSIQKYLNLKHIITLTGVRRCGKSVLLRQIISYLLNNKVKKEDMLFLNLENPYFDEYKDNIKNLELILDDYYKLMNPQGKIYLFLDEIQFFKNWQVFVKSKYENSNIKFIITGSNSQLLSSELITLLSGRTLNIHLYPFDFKEFLLAKKIKIKSKIDILKNQNLIRKHFDEFVRLGGFPEIAFIKDNNTKKEVLENYYKNIIYHDIIPRFEIKNINKTEKLAHYLLSNIGKPFSYNNLSKLIALSDKTIKEYTNYFSQAYLLFELKRFDFSIKKQINTPKKIYAIDTGLINAISFKFTEDIGRLYENLVFIELKRRRKEVYYHKDRYECDFIIKEESKITQAIQVCKSIRDPDTRKREILGIKEAIKKYKLKTALILTENEEEIINKKIQVIPLWKWLLG